MGGYRGAIPRASGKHSIELSDLEDIQAASLREREYQRGIVKISRRGVGVSGQINSRRWNSGSKEDLGRIQDATANCQTLSKCDSRTLDVVEMREPNIRRRRDATANHQTLSGRTEWKGPFPEGVRT